MLSSITFPLKALSLAFVAELSIFTVAVAQEQPRQSEAYTASLGDVMTIIQLRHGKVWYAAKLGNWPLAAYEFERLVASLRQVAGMGPDLPFESDPETNPLADAIAAMDEASFDTAFQRMTDACNSCHETAGLEFIVIRPPTRFSPYSNQIFEPR